MKFSILQSNIDVKAPLIYMWEIHDAENTLVGRYIGKANGGEKRPTRHYARNVARYLAGEPYRNGKQYRRVHLALAAAHSAGHRISLSYLCNVHEDQNIFEVEKGYIREYRSDAHDGIGLNGPMPGRTPVIGSAVASSPLRSANDAQMQPDLDDFLEIVEDYFPGCFEARAGKSRYSLYLEKSQRIVRAEQTRPYGPVSIKLAQSSRGGPEIKFTWDGSDAVVIHAIEVEMAVLRARARSA